MSVQTVPPLLAGVPTGGTTGQVLAKASATNYDANWVAQTGGGGGASAGTHEEFKPANGQTTVTVAQIPSSILMVSRNGLVQSATDGNYALAGSVLTFTDAFNGTERVVVEYATQTAPVVPYNGAGLVDGTVSNAKLASDTARANLLTNGGFEIWQRGAGPFVHLGGTAVPTVCDRWSPQLATGAGNITTTRESTTVDIGSQYSAKVVYTAGAGDAVVCGFQQQTSGGLDIMHLRGRTLSLSIRVNISAVGKVRLFYYDGVSGGNQRIYAPTYNQAANAWETLTFTFPVATNMTQFFVGLDMVMGASFTMYVDNAMLVVGSAPADYAPLHPADEIARCQRYYQRHDAVGGYSFMGPGQCISTTSGIVQLPTLGRFVSFPTVTFSAPSTFALTNGVGGAMAVTGIALQAPMNPLTSMALYLTGSSGLTVGMATWMCSNNVAAAILSEANS